MLDDTDAELVLRYRGGDRHAFDALMVRHSKRVFSVAFRVLNNREDAFDVTQTAFLKAYQHLGQYDVTQSFSPWLCRIAVNEALDRMRTQHAMQVLDDAIVDGHVGPVDLAIREQDDVALQNALMQLPADYRAIIVLKHLQGCSYEELAQILECPVKTVKSRLFTARQALRAVLVPKTGD
jgi:RNA polymerase sigma-70 factor (ECF subfamily)